MTENVGLSLAKQAAIAQWTADPCGPDATGEPGTKVYAEEILAGRETYAPWMSDVLGYADTRGLDVLDIGCGQGIDVCRYALAGARPWGVDLTPRHVELARAHVAALGLEATILEGDAEDLPLPDETFDRVSSNGVLHHTPNMLAALREARRVLRPGGEARIIVYNRTSAHYYVQQVLGHGILRRRLFAERSMQNVMSTTVEKTSIDARPLVHVYSPRALRKLMEEAGFRSVTTIVRHFRPEDTFVTKPLGQSARRGLDAIGRYVGWYVTGVGTR